MSERRTSITRWWSASLNSWALRANHWGPHGASTLTCLTTDEARAFFQRCDSRQPRRNPIPHTPHQENPAP